MTLNYCRNRRKKVEANNKVVSTHINNKSEQSGTNRHYDIKSISEEQGLEDLSKNSCAMSSFRKSEIKSIEQHNSKSKTKTSIMNELKKESKVSGIKF